MQKYDCFEFYTEYLEKQNQTKTILKLITKNYLIKQNDIFKLMEALNTQLEIQKKLKNTKIKKKIIIVLIIIITKIISNDQYK